MKNECKAINKQKKIIKGISNGGTITIFSIPPSNKNPNGRLGVNIRPNDTGIVFVLDWSQNNIWTCSVGNENTRVMPNGEEFKYINDFLIKMEISKTDLEDIRKYLSDPEKLLNSFRN